MENKFNISVSLLIFIFVLVSCNFTTTHQDRDNSLPILSPKVNDEYLPISDFQFTNQDGETISNSNTTGKVYVAEFFFTSCPSVCPIVSKQLKMVYETFKDESNFMILSHTIDPENDTILSLKDYYTQVLEIEGKSNWNLLRGEKGNVYDLANFSYGAVVYEDEEKLKDNIMHSGALLLVDKNGLIRGMFDGKDKDSTIKLIEAIKNLLN